MPRTLILLLAALLATACSERHPTAVITPCVSAPSDDVAAMKDQIARLQNENAELRATPAVMLAAVQAAGEDIAKSRAALELLKKKFPDAPQTKQAMDAVAQLEAARDKKEAEEKRLAALGLKALKVNSTITGDEATITLSSVTQAGRWISDAHDSQYHYRDAEKGSAFIIARVKAASTNKDPSLPGVALYRSEGAVLRKVASFGYEFVRWKDYGSYLGNYSDYGNDFAHTNAIPMTIGADAEVANLKRPLFLVATKEGCYKRDYERFRNPPVSYIGGSGCTALKDSLQAADFGEGRLALVHRLD